MNEREAFEAWAVQQGFNVGDRLDDGYYWPGVQRAWEGWQAASAGRAELVKELEAVLEWARVEKAPLRDREIKSIRAVLKKHGA